MKFNRPAGFTLIEVALAVAILGVGLVTIIGLQTNYAKLYARERMLMRAALYAQYLMSVLDADDDFPEESVGQKDLAPVLESAGYFDEDSAERKVDAQALDGWRYELQLTRIGVPPIEDALERIDMVISWGEGEQFRLVYFLPGQIGAD